MTRTMLLASAAVLALTGGAHAAVAHNAKAAVGAHGKAPRVIHAPAAGLATLYDQNIGDGYGGFFSQTLSSYPQYDEYLADDFTVPAGRIWKVKEVDVTGFYYVVYGPAHSVNVLFWKDKHGLPKGDPVAKCDNLTPASGLDTGAFQIKLPKTCKIKLSGGKTYSVTVQANMDGLFTSGYWAWQTNRTINGSMASGWWYGGGISTLDPSCNVQFEPFSLCTGSTYDLAFALLGKPS